MQFIRSVAGAAALSAAAIACAQSAVLHDGTVLIQKVPLEIFGTEGPMWDIDVEKRQVRVTGRVVTMPAMLNGSEFAIEGTDVVGLDGHSLGPITAANFDRLADVRAAVKDVVPDTACPDCGILRFGPIRSLFSTTEARGGALVDGDDELDRVPEIQRMIEDNYFFLARNIYVNHASTLGVDWLGRIGIRDQNGAYPTNPNQLPNRRYWKYPGTAGGTLKSAGTIYVDAQGNEYMIPDLEAVIELSENVVLGPVRSVSIGNFNTPDSFVVGDVVVMMNQDPRFGSHIMGIAGANLSREFFFANLPVGTEIAVVGHMVSEHLQMAQEIEVGIYDPSLGVSISAAVGNGQRFRVDVARGDISWRGNAMPAEDLTLSARIGTSEFPADAVPDGVIAGLVHYGVDVEGIDLIGVTEVVMIARDAKGNIVKEQAFDITPFIQ